MEVGEMTTNWSKDMWKPGYPITHADVLEVLEMVKKAKEAADRDKWISALAAAAEKALAKK